MSAITIADLNNAKQDVDLIAAIATSLALTVTDRLGNIKKTVAGEMAAIDAALQAQLVDAQGQINVSVANAAASAAAALGYLNAYRTTSYGALASDPTVDPLGNPPTEGDEYFNTVAKLLKRWNGSTWQASDISTANLAAPTGSALVGHQPDGTGAVATTVQQVLRESISVFRFMTPAQIADARSMSPSMDASLAFATGIAVLRQLGGGSLKVPHARYLMNGFPGADGIKNGILLPFTGGADFGATAVSINLIFEDRDTTLVAGSNNMIMIRCSTSYSEISSFQIDSNGKTGVFGLALIPENTTTPNVNSQQSHNHIHDFLINGCAEGIILQCGGNGGAYYNHIGPGQVYGNSLNGTRGVYLKTGAAGAVSPPNRNHFMSVRVGDTNTGFEIEAGDTNKFTACSVEGITAGSAPSATPTGLIVRNTDNNTPGYGNQGNMFFGFVAESCTQDALILNSRTSFFGFCLNAAKTTLASDFVSGGSGTMVGSYDSTVFPNIYAGTIEYGSQLPNGIGSYEYGEVRTNVEYFDRGYKYKSFGLTTSNVGNVQSINEAKSYCTKLANMVDWSFRFQFLPVASNSVITVPLPVAASLNAYATYSLMPPFVFLVRIIAGSNEVVGFAEVNYEAPAGTFLKIRLPSGATWNMSGNYNSIHGQIRYRAA